MFAHVRERERGRERGERERVDCVVVAFGIDGHFEKRGRHLLVTNVLSEPIKVLTICAQTTLLGHL